MKIDPPRRRVLVVCPYPEGVAAGQRLKYEQYFEDWRRLGLEVIVSPFMDHDLWNVAFIPGRRVAKAVGLAKGYGRRLRDLVRVRHFDLVYLFMWATPIGTAGFERSFRHRAKRLIYDLEDNVAFSRAEQQGHPNPLLRLLRGPQKYLYLLRTADHVIASSPSLAEECRERNAHHAATYISSSVDTDRFVPTNRYENYEVPTIGWTGTFSSRPFLDLIAPMLRELAKRRRFRLRVIGNFDYELPGIDLEVIRWTAEREVEDMQGIDIGLYPLPVDDWVSGKSGLKAIQYMAFGLPCVATNVGTTPRIIRHGENGMLVRDEADWLVALEKLLDDPALRRRLGEQARRDAVEKYSVKAVAADYRQVLETVMKDGPRG